MGSDPDQNKFFFFASASVTSAVGQKSYKKGAIVRVLYHSIAVVYTAFSVLLTNSIRTRANDTACLLHTGVYVYVTRVHVVGVWFNFHGQLI